MDKARELYELADRIEAELNRQGSYNWADRAKIEELRAEARELQNSLDN